MESPEYEARYETVLCVVMVVDGEVAAPEARATAPRLTGGPLQPALGYRKNSTWPVGESEGPVTVARMWMAVVT